jgi:hypothetical protein
MSTASFKYCVGSTKEKLGGDRVACFKMVMYASMEHWSPMKGKGNRHHDCKAYVRHG